MDQLTIHRKRAFFWSDTHFWHRHAAEMRASLLPGDGQGQVDPEAMNGMLIDLAKSKLSADTTLFLLGDVSFAGTRRTIEVLEQIPGRIVLVRGNHDKSMNGQVLARFESVHSLLTVKVIDDAHEDGGIPLLARIVCCHFPMLSWDMQHYGAWHLHGHSHGSMRYPWPDAKIMDVGVDTRLGSLGPVSFDMLQEVMDSRQTRTSDNHKPEKDRHA